MDGRRLLNENGIFSTWLPLRLPETTLLSIIKTFTGVFENTLFIYPHYTPGRHILLIGQKSGHPYNFLDAKKEYEKEKVRESLSLIGIHDITELLEYLLTDYSSLTAVAAGARTNSDYFPFVEFDVNRAHLVGDQLITWKNLGTIVRNTRRVDYHRLFSFEGLDEKERCRTLERLVKSQAANEYLLESFCIHTLEEKIQLVNEGLRIAPEDQDLLRMKKQLF
jgi:hypothetical protein